MTKYPVYIRISCFYPCDSLHRGGITVAALPVALPRCLLQSSNLASVSLLSYPFVFVLVTQKWIQRCTFIRFMYILYNDVFRFFFLLFTFQEFFVVFVSSLGICLFSAVFVGLNISPEGLGARTTVKDILANENEETPGAWANRLPRRRG